MRKRFFGSALLLICSCLAFAQSTYPILQTQKPERGVYLSFAEFQNNSPSVKIEFTLKPRSKSKQFWLGGSDYDVVFTDPGTVFQGKKIWGVSTGDSIFVNVSNFQANSGYIKFMGIGRYCYLKGHSSGNQTSVGVGTGGAVGIAKAIPSEAAYVLNINNGNFFMVDKSLLEKVLEKDTELLGAYSNESKRRDADVIISYVRQYNERHKDEIGAREKLSQLTIYRRDKKQKPEPVTIVSSDSVQFALAPSDYKTFFLKKGMVTLCLGKHCETFSLSIDEVTYLECTFKEDEARPQLLVRPKKEGEFYRRQIEFENEKKHAPTP